jgi:hypothetical protein
MESKFDYWDATENFVKTLHRNYEKNGILKDLLNKYTFIVRREMMTRADEKVFFLLIAMTGIEVKTGTSTRFYDLKWTLMSDIEAYIEICGIMRIRNAG